PPPAGRRLNAASDCARASRPGEPPERPTADQESKIFTADPEVITVDVAVIGAGAAGLRAAYEAAAAGARTLIITKGRIAVSGATAVGLASSAGFAGGDGAGDPQDNPAVHYNDIRTAAQGCADPALVRILVDGAIDAVADLDRCGIDFIRDPATGKPLVAQGDFASRPRNRKIYHH